MAKKSLTTSKAGSKTANSTVSKPKGEIMTVVDDLTGEAEKMINSAVKSVKTKQQVEKIYCYKVFRRMDDGLLHSASVPVGSKLHKIYHENKKTVVNSEMFNNGYGIICFPDYSSARNFKGTNKGIKEIWKVEVGQVGDLAARRPSIYDLEELVPADKMAKSSYRVVLSRVVRGATKAEWPPNTISCDYVIPIEKVS
jgi:hypothetical protein